MYASCSAIEWIDDGPFDFEVLLIRPSLLDNVSVRYIFNSYFQQVLLLHKASKGSFSRVFDFEANDLKGEDSGERTR